MPLLLGDTPNTHAQHTHAAALGRHAQYTRAAPNRLPLVLGVVGADGLCSKSKLPTTHNHHHHHHCRRRHQHHCLLFQLLLKVFIVALVIFKRLNPGAAVDGAQDVLVVRRHLPAAEPTPRLPLGDT